MTLKDVDKIIEELNASKFSSEDTGDSKMFNLGIDRAIDIINSASKVDVKIKITDKKAYQRDYYQRVTKVKRAQKKQEQQGDNK